MLPSFTSHIIAAITLAIPGMILAETALSFQGIGLRPPITSWGVHPGTHKTNLIALIQAPPIDLNTVAGRAGVERKAAREA
jgi:peptide/nickel transport system permease protein